MLVLFADGGTGQCMVDVLNAWPQLDPATVVLQDRPEIIEIAQNDPELPTAMVKMVHDFKTPQPIKNAKAYYMRFIVHAYLDDAAVALLTHIREAMAPDSKLLIAEMVIPDRLDEASLSSGMYDMLLFNGGGKERTEAEYEKLLNAAGLKKVKVWMKPESPQGIVEAVLA